MIINSLLDTDLYKLTMSQCYFHQMPNIGGEYTFKCRTPGINLGKYEQEIRKEIDNFCSLYFKPDELDYLESLGYFKDDYLAYLKQYKPDRSNIGIISHANELMVQVSGQFLHDITFFEVPVLAIINEVYFRHLPNMSKMGILILDEKIKKLKKWKGFQFADFGTRRRYSHDWQEYVIRRTHQRTNALSATSNPYFAKKYNIPVVGTMAHEFVQSCQALTHPINSQKLALELWLKEYDDKLGIALTDTLGVDKFLFDFNRDLANAYTGVRQDSGSPDSWTNSLLKHYNKLNIDPKTKTAIYSDGLNIDIAYDLYNKYKDIINVSFGIGTSFTNDMDINDTTAIQIVMKLTKCNGLDVAKLSDSVGKEMCQSPEYIAYLKKILQKELYAN